MNKLKPYNSKAIIANVAKVIKSYDMKLLSKSAYNFIYQQSGFIAHYDYYGFIDYYEDNVGSFIADMFSFRKDSEYFGGQWFREQYGDEYVDSKVNTLLGIANLLPMFAVIK